MKIKWQALEGAYVDVTIPEIDGIFRFANSDGVDLEKYVNRVMENVEFFQHLVEVGIRKVFEESDTHENWGNGWNWKETTHPKLAKGFRIGSAQSWFTCPFGDRLPEVRTMRDLHNVQDQGIRLLYSYNCNRAPVVVGYFFPSSATVSSAA